MLIKKFAGRKSAQDIIDQCAADGIKIDVSKHEAGGDHLVVTLPGPAGEGVQVLYNVVSGRFFSAPPDGERFSSDDQRDDEPWFAAMLVFFFKEAVSV